MKKFFVSIIVTLTMLLSFVSIPTIGMAAAASPTTPEYINESQVKQNMDKLVKCLVGKYFTVNGNPCNKPGKSGHGCSNCNVRNVIKNSSFKNAVNQKVPTNINISPLVHYYGNRTLTNGSSCCGFANFAEWYIFASKNTDAVKTINMTKSEIDFNYNNMKNKALPGDIIRLDGHHSAIVYSINRTSVTIIDCNSNNKKDGNCRIRKYDTSYSSYKKVGIARASNYKAYNIKYNGNGGYGAPAAQAKVKDVDLKLSSTIPSRKGYSFLGWATNSKAKTPDYTAGCKYKNNADVTLYAVWSRNFYA